MYYIDQKENCDNYRVVNYHDRGFEMALIKCLECGKNVSSLANACPNCGCPVGSMLSVMQEELNLKTEPSISFKMLYLGHDNRKLDVKCGRCNRESTIRLECANGKSYGYEMDGEGECSCGLRFDKVYFADDSSVEVQYQMDSNEYVQVKCLECGKQLNAPLACISTELDGHVTFNTGGCSCGNCLYFVISDSYAEKAKHKVNSHIIGNLIIAIIYSVLIYMLLDVDGNAGNRYLLYNYLDSNYYITMLLPIVALVLSVVFIIKKSVWSSIFSIAFYVSAFFIVLSFNNTIVKYENQLPNPYYSARPLFKIK